MCCALVSARLLAAGQAVFQITVIIRTSQILSGFARTRPPERCWFLMEPDHRRESPEARWTKLQEQAFKARLYALMLAGDPAAERLEAWADELTAEAVSIAASSWG
jgi:hypothetical protein